MHSICKSNFHSASTDSIEIYRFFLISMILYVNIGLCVQKCPSGFQRTQNTNFVLDMLALLTCTCLFHDDDDIDDDGESDEETQLF